MKRTLLFSLMCLVAAQVSCFASDARKKHDHDGENDRGMRQERMQEKRVDHLADKLELTAEQKEKLAAILKEEAATNKAAMEQQREAMKAEQEKRRTEMQERKAATDEKIKGILTPEQAQAYDQLREKQKAKREKAMKKKMNRKKDMDKGCCPDSACDHMK